MNKTEFLKALKKQLSDLPGSEVQERLSFYSEMIDDYMEEGATEEEAVERIGIIDEGVAQSTGNASKGTSKTRVRVLLIAGSPIWISLLAAAAAVVVSVYAALWAGIVSLWAGEVSLMVSTLGGIAMSATGFLSDNPLWGWAMVGATVFCIGAAILLFQGCKAASGGVWYLTKQFPRWVKALFREKEDTL